MPDGRAGFTLVELLAVIFIIGLLAVIVITSLGGNRNRAKDIAIKSSLLEVAKAAELLAGAIGGYGSVCDPTDVTLTSDGDLGRMKISIENQGGIISCKDSDTQYAVISELNQGNCWCVDWQGQSREVELTGADTCADVLISANCP